MNNKPHKDSMLLPSSINIPYTHPTQSSQLCRDSADDYLVGMLCRSFASHSSNVQEYTTCHSAILGMSWEENSRNMSERSGTWLRRVIADSETTHSRSFRWSIYDCWRRLGARKGKGVSVLETSGAL